MKKLRNVLFTLAILTLCLFLLPTEADAVSISDLTFELNDDRRSYSVADCKESAGGELIIPATYNGKPLTAIGAYAFSNCMSITSVTIPSSVTRIGSSAFSNCGSLTGVYITDLAVWCEIDFEGTMANPLLYAHKLYLNKKLVTDITIPYGVTTIGDYAFDGCESLISITIPDGVTSIGLSAFSRCSKLIKVFLPDSITYIGTRAFERCSSLSYSTYDDAKYLGNIKNPYLALIKYPNTYEITQCTVHSNTKVIGNDAFNGCRNLAGVTIPESVTTIGDYAFYNCITLTGIFIPGSITKIGDWAFYNCDGLAEVTIPGSVSTIGRWAFSDCDRLATVSISGDVTAIDDYAFASCSSLTDITLPASVTVIGEGLFNECAALVECTIPGQITAIGGSAFSGCTSLVDIIIPDNVKTIGAYAFSNCTNLTDVVIPDTVTTIGNALFKNCTGLTGVKIGNGIRAVSEDMFFGCSSLTDITIPDSVTMIGKTAFTECIGLIRVTTGNGVTVIGDSAFENCTALTDITIGNGVTTIGDSAFRNCSALADMVMGDSVTTIGQYAFKECKSLKKLVTSNCLKSIDEQAFANCVSLTSVTIPSGVAVFSQSVFQECTALADVTFSEGIQRISSHMFYGCTSLTDIKLPNSITSIGAYAFYNCSSINSIAIPNNVTQIGNSAFLRCTSLKSVELGSGITQLAIETFKSCSMLTKILFPMSIKSINTKVFDNCDNLSKVYFRGTQADWDRISISYGNDDLNNAEYIFNYTGETIHSYGDWTTIESATCTEVGSKERNCTVCTAVEMQIVPAKGHAYASGICTVCKIEFPLDLADYDRSATIIKTSGANIWNKPYTSGTSKMVRTAEYNSKVNVVGYAYNASGSLWYKLSDGNWVYSTNIRVTDYNPADVEAISKTFVVTSWGANIWSKPYSSGDSKVVKSVEKTAALSVVGQVRNSTGGLWYMLEDGNWIYSKNVNERIFDPADVIAYKRSATVIVPGVINIWGQPSTKAPSTLTRTAAYQTKLNVVAKYTTPTGGLWYQLTDGNWVYSTNIRITDYNPADVQKVNKTVTVTSWGANVWSKPYSSGDSKVVKTVAKAANLKIDGQVRNSTYGLWYRLADGSGWIYSQNVKVK